MDNEKKLQIAKGILKKFIDGDCVTDDEILSDFPELRESEDERIRKWLVDYFGSIKETVWIHREFTCDQILSWLEKQKEQKPGTLTDGVKEYTIREDYTSAYYEERGYARGYNDGVRDSKLVSSKPPQKPVEPQDYSGLTDLERAIHRGFLCAGVENVPVTIIKETAKECLTQMKPAEWSEEDEKNREWILECLADGERKVLEFAEQYQAAFDWLKSLRPQPSWKPSEEQMAWLKLAVEEANEPLKSQLAELYKDIRENLIWK